MDFSQMRVHIVGSVPNNTDDDTVEKMKADCMAIGAGLRKSGASLSIGSVLENTADRHVLAGYIKGSDVADSPPSVYIFMRKYEGVDKEVSATEEKFGLQMIRSVTEGTSASRHITAMKDATAVLILGGRGGTTTAGYGAPILGKPILAVPNYGGAGKEIWEALQYTYGQSALTQELIKKIPISSGNELAEHVRSALHLLVSSNPFSHKIPKAQWIFNVFVLMCLVAWVAVFSNSDVFNPYAAVFLLMGLASCIGTGLRTLLRVYFDYIENFSPKKTISDFMIGLVISFGFFLLFFVGGAIYDLPQNEVIKSENATKSGALLSLVSLSVSFLLEKSVSTFRERIAKIIQDKTPDIS